MTTERKGWEPSEGEIRAHLRKLGWRGALKGSAGVVFARDVLDRFAVPAVERLQHELARDKETIRELQQEKVRRGRGAHT